MHEKPKCVAKMNLSMMLYLLLRIEWKRTSLVQKMSDDAFFFGCRLHNQGLYPFGPPTCSSADKPECCWHIELWIAALTQHRTHHWVARCCALEHFLLGQSEQSSNATDDWSASCSFRIFQLFFLWFFQETSQLFGLTLPVGPLVNGTAAGDTAMCCTPPISKFVEAMHSTGSGPRYPAAPELLGFGRVCVIIRMLSIDSQYT